ncbi:innexin inx2-like protein [Dinothrombium tinctorium]|uniref:Innexin n=1 Tax=Dinothrombium tinctorium TaxID=1965070 RepID=A0A3S3RSB1_9ACAR|nr:innexin inx2-like protein [Dinothrombium tinctorium]RWS05238.1 innexin inx2-like protein [Dinothrombium tinctorium]
MFGLFSGLKFLIHSQSVTIDNVVCRLHYRLTVIILLAFTLLMSAHEYFGEPIYCTEESNVPTKLMNTFCWIHSTFSVERAWEDTVGTKGVPYPGIAQAKNGDLKVYHKYYQWVPFMLFIQAILFYIPRYLWKLKEGGRVKRLILGLDSAVIPEDQKEYNIRLLLNYFRCNLNTSNSFFAFYVFTEFLNFGNVVFQMYLINKFLGGTFMSYGWRVLMFEDWSPELRFDPMLRVFPRMAKCIFHLYGSSGDVKKHDVLCLLPINILNEKIYIFLWFWMWFLLIVTLCLLIFRVLTISLPFVRILVTQSRCFPSARRSLNKIIQEINVGDWYFLDLLSRNIDRINFSEFVEKCEKTFESKAA